MKTMGDIYESVIETESPAAEAVQIFDTPGDVSWMYNIVGELQSTQTIKINTY